jgi:hypothetical protein
MQRTSPDKIRDYRGLFIGNIKIAIILQLERFSRFCGIFSKIKLSSKKCNNLIKNCKILPKNWYVPMPFLAEL